ncbi:MAG: hypothetical protein E7647_03440 [Ruminococcaceae bacterium]|nr:hypothetical protein [Oscillospiraceae bacterium]
MKSEAIKEKNREFFRLLSKYLNFCPDGIDGGMIEEAKSACGVSTEEAYRILFSGIMDVYSDRELRSGWISRTFRCLDASVYENDPYRKTVKLPSVADGEWEFVTDSYKPYEAFVYNDPEEDGEGRIIPKIGFFEREYVYPAVKQGGREWMLITPNEIETMKEPVARVRGSVATYGLGLGYFAFMASEKKEVDSVCIVESDASVIRLFKKHILPQFPNRDKITVIHGDAFLYAREGHHHDFVFADIWHDPSDGCEAYLKLKGLEREGCEYAYWIEKTIKLYI